VTKLKETDLYPPVKKLLEDQGYEVKSEVGAADVMAVRGAEPPVIVELKTGFTLSLFHQAIERLAITDAVYVAVPRGKGRPFLSSLKGNKKLCRRLGLGLITVRPDDGFCEIHLDPGPYAPRKNNAKTTRLLREFAHRIGDPNLGGSTRTTIVTAYRQDAMRIAAWLAGNGAAKASDVAKATGVPRARTIMADDHYGWFEKVERGIYRLSPKGEQAAGELPPS
jgi:hypothetical protein